MLKNVKVRLQPLVGRLNLPTVIKTAILPGEQYERLFIATQVGEIFYIGDRRIETFLDIRSRILRLGTSNGGYDERGLLGLAFHPDFRYNGLFYLHYSVAGSQGPGALSRGFSPNPCDPNTLNMDWTNRETRYDHIDTVEEWMLDLSGVPQKRRTLLNLRRPFSNHNGVNSLNFSPESGMLVLTTGDGGAGYDPFNLSQDDMEIAGKIIEIDVSMDLFITDPPAVTRFDELPQEIQESLTVIAKGVRNIPGITYQPFENDYIKYVGNVGQDLVESVFSFVDYKPLPVPQIIRDYGMNLELEQEGFINLGWRGWEGDLPTAIIRDCTDPSLDMITTAYFKDTISTSTKRILPLTCYYHRDFRPDKLEGTALTGVQTYMGRHIPDLEECVLFTDFARKGMPLPVRGALAYTKILPDCKVNEYSIIDVDYDFGPQSAYYTSLGTNLDQTRLFLGVYSSTNVTDLNLGTVFEIIP